MNRKTLTAVAFPIAAVAIWWILQGSAASRINWRTDYAAARTEAQSAGRLLLLDFWASGNGPCELMDSQVFSRADCVTAMSNLVPVRVDLSEGNLSQSDARIAKRFGVSGLPTYMVVDPGTESIRFQRSGGATYNQFLDFLKHAGVK